jgi:hypothetical protein
MKARLAGLTALLTKTEQQEHKKRFHDSSAAIKRMQDRLFADPRQELFKVKEIADATGVCKQTVWRGLCINNPSVGRTSKYGTFLIPKEMVSDYITHYLFYNK